jgi:hypothetical protein
LAADVAFLGLAACQEAALPINGFFHDAITFEFPLGTYASDRYNPLCGRESLGEARSCVEEITSVRDLITVCMVRSPNEVLNRDFGVRLEVPLVVDFKCNR